MKIDGRSISHEALEISRFAAIKLKKSGVAIDVIAKSFNVTERAVYRWLNKSKTDGVESLKSSKATGPESHLTVDGAPTHTAIIVKEFVKKNKSWLRLEILPAYSPELNPTEKAWRFLKTKKLNGSTVRDKKDLRDETNKMIKQIKKDKVRVATFFDK